jgi:hypothetical protein
MPWRPKNNNIDDFPFHEFQDNAGDIQDKLKYYKPHLYATWILPQILAHFGRFRVKEPCWREVARENLTDDWNVGLWRLVVQQPRSVLVSQQNKNAKYGALTPLILAGLVEGQGIPYSAWDLQDPDFALMETRLLDAIQTPVPDVSTETLLELRDDILTYKTGPKTGQHKNPESVWSTGGMRSTPLEPSPALQRVMLLQIWLAHPAIRHPLMILDPRNPDKTPDALINSKNSAVFSSQVPNQVEPQTLPWM